VEATAVAEAAWLSAEEEAELRARESARRVLIDSNKLLPQQMLSLRFGALPGDLTTRIEACDSNDRLLAALHQVVKITAMDQLEI
jgi:hypothetical protein